MKTISIPIPDIANRCRWCGATERRGLNGSTWANAKRSLCSGCDEIEKLARTPAGRQFIARMLRPLLSADAATKKRKAS